MVFNTSLMPGLLTALQQEDRRSFLQALQRVPEIPRSCQWAHALADGRRLAPLCEHDRRRIELAWGLVSSLPGAPVINFGDEIGMGGAVGPGSRNGSRGPMQWSPHRNGGFSRADSVRLPAPVDFGPDSGYQVVNVETQERRASSLLNWIRRLIAVRGQHRALRRGSIEYLETRNHTVLTYLRRDGDERVLVIANLSGKAQSVDLLLSLYAGTQPVELIGGANFRVIGAGEYSVALAPYGFYWLVLNRRAARVSSSRGVDIGALRNGTDATEALAIPA
jgi:maltose alpha-D-glucosyltransferase/alpha-amylase